MSVLSAQKFSEYLDEVSPFPYEGHVTNITGFVIEGYCPRAIMGAVCELVSADRKNTCLAEIVGFRDDKAILMPLGELRGMGMGSRIRVVQTSATAKVGMALLGRVIDALGNPIDGQGPLDIEEEFSIYSSPINPLRRTKISEPLDVGVRAVNSLLTFGKGQRVAILAGSGVGKSVLLGMMARNTTAQINVICLVGERGREVREFIDRDIGPEGMKRSVVIVAPSDAPPVVRMRAVFMATTVAEYFRRESKDVLFMMDSVTRFAMARREVGLSAGEPPTTKGYPPSVFTLLPKIFERAGNTSSSGSITGIFTVLIEGDDINDPIGDAVRSIVDGHLVLSRKIAAKNQYPAIDILNSASRVMPEIVPPEHLQMASRVRSVLASYTEAEDLINIGAYVKGSNPSIDEAIQYIDSVRALVKQPLHETSNFQQSTTALKNVFTVPNAQPQAERRAR